MTESEAPALTPAQIIESLASMQIIAETVAGYHRKLLDGGISPEVAGSMAQEFHTYLMETMKSQIAVALLKKIAPGKFNLGGKR